jgi:hypothetical protein
VPVGRLAAVLLKWKLCRRHEEERGVLVDGVLRTSRGVLLLEVKLPHDPWPAYPLRPRAAPVRGGEKVALVGCPLAEPTTKQNLYNGRVTRPLPRSCFEFHFDPPVRLRGFDGAPVLDEHGRAVGVLTGSAGDPTPDGKDRRGRAAALRAVLGPP